MERQQEFEVLKGLSSRAVVEFEELQSRCKEFYTKCTEVQDQNQKLKSQFKQLKRVSLLAVTEYENLVKRYNDEVKIKEETKSKLKKVEEENKELRKSSKMAPNVSIIPANTNMAATEGASKGELEGLRSLLIGMKDEMRRTKSDFTKVESQFEDEKRDHDSTKHKLKIASAQIVQLNKVSVMALDEFKDLRIKYDLEVECRRKAEEYASQLLHSQQSETRMSKLVKENPLANDQLEKAFEEVEELNKTLAKERSEHQQKVKNLTEELDSSKDNDNIKALEDKMTVALDQIELLQSQLQESESRILYHEQRARELNDKLLRTEAAMASGVNMTLPIPAPPPPPPPPPPMSAPVIRKFITRIGGGKRKKEGPVTDKDDPVQDMMKEMMNRIKKGALLKSKNQLKEDDKSPAMNELADLLTNLKQGQSANPEAAEKEEKVPEFQKFKLRKVSEPPKVAEKKTNPDNELMRKLGKQKLAAENEGPKIEEHVNFPLEKELCSKEELVNTKSVEDPLAKSSANQDEVTHNPTNEKLERSQSSRHSITKEQSIDERVVPQASSDSSTKCGGQETQETKREEDTPPSEEAGKAAVNSGMGDANASVTDEKSVSKSNDTKDTLEKSFDAIFDEINEFLQ